MIPGSVQDFQMERSFVRNLYENIKGGSVMRKRNTLKRAAAGILAGAMVFGLTACGGSSAPAENTAAQSEGTTEQGSAQNNGQKTMIKIGLANTVPSLQPFKGTGLYYGFVDGQVYQRLGQRTDFATQTFRPVLMTEYHTDDGVNYDITIRDDIYDSAGVHLTAADVAWCFNHVKENGLNGNSYIDHAEATGDYTFVLTLANDDLWSFEAALEAVCIVTKESFEASEDGMATKPVGTGPYVVKEFITGSKVVLEENENYWADKAEGLEDLPIYRHNVDCIELDFLTEATQMSVALQTGEIQMGLWLNEAIVDECREYPEYTVETLDNRQMCELLFNVTDQSPCSDVNLRKAIAYAVNNQLMIDNALHGIGTVSPALGKTGLAGYNEKWETEYEYYPYDAEKAKELVAASGYNGEELSIMIQSNALYRSEATVLQENLKAVGINARIDEYDMSTRNKYVVAGSGYHYDIALYNLSAGGSYLIQTLESWLNEDRYGNGMNMFGSSDPKLQELTLACGEEDWTQDDYDELYKYVYDNCYLYQWYDSKFSYAAEQGIVIPDEARSALNGEFLIGALELPENWSHFQ